MAQNTANPNGIEDIEVDEVSSDKTNVTLTARLSGIDEAGNLTFTLPYSEAVKGSKSAKSSKAGFMVALTIGKAGKGAKVPGWGTFGAAKGAVWVPFLEVGTGTFKRTASGEASKR